MATKTIATDLKLTDSEAWYLVLLLNEETHDRWREDIDPVTLSILGKLGVSTSENDYPSDPGPA
jgi:hypothetical protein